MMSKESDLIAIRTRWGNERGLMNLSSPLDPNYALGGLGSLSRDPDIRLAVLPADPHTDAVALDEEVIDWLQTGRTGEYRDVFGYGQARTTSSAAVMHERSEEAKWGWFVAIHRHGGIDASHSSMARVSEEGKFFFLREIISYAWSCLDLQKEAIDRWAIHSPLEMTLALRGTKDAFLSDFAQGWEPAFSIYRFSTPCLEPNVLLRWEFDHDFDPEELAMDVGFRIENAFGSVSRRYIANRGEYEGKFDPTYR